MTNTDVKRDDLPEIAPRMVDGVGYCDAGCPQYREELLSDFCDFDGSEFTNDGDVCPVWATRTAARLEAVEEWNKDVAGVLELATGVPDNTIQIMRQEGLKIEDIEDPMQKLAFTIHTEACEIANKAEALLDTYPGKQPTSRQKDGQYD